MDKHFFLDEDKSVSTVMEVPAFPWVRFDAEKFIWEEALYEGNYMAVHYSAMGRCHSRERVYERVRNKRIRDHHFRAFELEINGQVLRDHWEWKGNEIRKTDRGHDDIVTTLSYRLLPVEVSIHTVLDGTSFMERWLEIENRGEQSFAITGVSPLCGIIGSQNTRYSLVGDNYKQTFMLGSFNENHSFAEGEFYWQPLPNRTYSCETFQCYHNPPMFIVKNQATGEMTVIHLAATDNMKVDFTYSVPPNVEAINLVENYLHVNVGLSRLSTYRTLQPGERATTPSVHYSMLYGDLDNCVNHLYAHLRKSVVPPQPEGSKHLVEYNHTGYTFNALVTNELLKKEIDVAASVGSELFVIDAGWYGSLSQAWSQSMGDWQESELLENGLLELFDYAREKGMKSGLWMPIEDVALTSNFAKEHPEWLLQKSGKAQATLNLLDPVVEDYMYNKIVETVEKYKLDCFRIDGGLRGSSDEVIGGVIENTNWLYYDKLYALFERVQRRFPGLLLENCSGGGGRIDLGIMKRFHWAQITDNWNPPQQLRILNGITLGLAPEQCMTLNGAINENSSDVDFMLRTGLFGHFCISGVFPSVDKSNASSLARWRHAVNLYKNEMRPILDTCNVFHHTPIQDYSKMGDWVVLEFAAQDESAAIAGLFRLPDSISGEYLFVAKGLDTSREYEVTFDNTGKRSVVSGLQLCMTGLLVHIPGALLSELLIIKEKRTGLESNVQ